MKNSLEALLLWFKPTGGGVLRKKHKKARAIIKHKTPTIAYGYSILDGAGRSVLMSHNPDAFWILLYSSSCP